MFRFRPPLRPFRIPSPPRNPTHFRTYKQQRFGRGPQYKRFDSPSGGISGLLFRWAASRTFYRDVGLITATTGGIYLLNIEEVPVSGRRRFNIISAGIEERMGKASVEQAKEMYQGMFLPENDPRVRKVKQVLDRLIPFAEGQGLKGMDWEIYVIDSKEQNAFVAPGGKVFVFTGILPLCHDEDGIAAVLGHEIAHVVAHHSAEQLSHRPFVFIGIGALLAFDMSFGLASTLVDVILSMPASRKHEAEADYIGLMMMAQACYNPEAAMHFWNRIDKLGQGSPPQILSTHPSHHNREEKIREWLPKAKDFADKSECHLTSMYADQFAQAFSGFDRWA